MTKNENNNEGKVFCSICPDWEITDIQVAPTILEAGKKHYFCNEDCLSQFNSVKK